MKIVLKDTVYAYRARRWSLGWKALLRNPATLIWAGISLSMLLLIWAALLAAYPASVEYCHPDEVAVPGGGCVLRGYDFADVPPCESGRGEHDVRECLEKI